MRLSRQSALAARTAITVTLDLEDEANFPEKALDSYSEAIVIEEEEDEEYSLRGSGRLSKSKKKKQNKKGSKKDVIVYAATAQHLPSEIQSIIVGYLDDEKDYWSIHSLMQVSRVWWLHLGVGEQAEEAWSRRILEGLGYTAKKKAPRCKTFRHTFSVYLTKHCVGCWKKCLGRHEQVYKPWSPWLRVCSSCRGDEKSFMETVDKENRNLFGISSVELHNLVDEKDKCVWKQRVLSYMNEKRQEALEAVQTVLSNGTYDGQQKPSSIMAAFKACAYVHHPLSYKLRTLVNNAFRDGTYSSRTLDHIARVYERMMEMTYDVEDYVERLDIGHGDVRKMLGVLVPSKVFTETRMDKLIKRECDPWDLIQFVLDKRDWPGAEGIQNV